MISRASANSGYLRSYDQPKLNQIFFFLLCDEHINIHTTSPHDCGDDNDDNDDDGGAFFDGCRRVTKLVVVIVVVVIVVVVVVVVVFIFAPAIDDRHLSRGEGAVPLSPFVEAHVVGRPRS